MVLLATSCKKTETKVEILGCTDPMSSTYNPMATINDGSCQYNGKVVFWINKNVYGITVTINGQMGYITKYYQDYNPTCGSDGCATFTLPVGSYSFHATNNSLDWNGNISITSNGCSPMLLKN